MDSIEQDFALEGSGNEFEPLTADQAQQWRQRNPSVSAWQIVGMQVMVACVLVLAVWLGVSDVAAISVAYGATAVILPASVFVRGLRRQSALKDSASVVWGFAVWESVKVVLTVVMLLLAPWVIPAMNWLALLAGFVVTMKVYWFAGWWQTRRPHLT